MSCACGEDTWRDRTLADAFSGHANLLARTEEATGGGAADARPLRFFLATPRILAALSTRHNERALFYVVWRARAPASHQRRDRRLAARTCSLGCTVLCGWQPWWAAFRLCPASFPCLLLNTYGACARMCVPLHCVKGFGILGGEQSVSSFVGF